MGLSVRAHRPPQGDRGGGSKRVRMLPTRMPPTRMLLARTALVPTAVILLAIAGCDPRSDPANPGGGVNDPASSQRPAGSGPLDAAVKDAAVKDAAVKYADGTSGNIANAASVAADFRQTLIANANDAEGLQGAAIKAGKAGRSRQAAQFMVAAVEVDLVDAPEIENQSSPAPAARVQLAVQALMAVGEVYQAIDLIERVLETFPQRSDLRRTLYGFYGEMGRDDLAAIEYQRLVRERKFDAMLLNAGTETSTRRFSLTAIDGIMDRNPTDRRPLLGRAQQQVEDADPRGCLDTIDQILEFHPSFAPAIAMRGWVKSQHDFSAESDWLADWLDSAGGTATDQFRYWMTIGYIAAEQHDWAASAAGYDRAAQLAPNEPTAWLGLAGALRRGTGQSGVDPAAVDSGANDSAAVNSAAVEAARAATADKMVGAERRAAGLLELRKRFFQFSTDRDNPLAAIPMIEQLLELGRNWEAEAWSSIAITMSSKLDPRIAELRRRAIEHLKLSGDWISPIDHPEIGGPDATDSRVASSQASGKPVPRAVADWIQRRRSEKLSPADPNNTNDLADPGDGGGNRFESDRLPAAMVDEAAQRGLTFYGQVGRTVAGPHVVLTETLGCGGGAIDFDLDGSGDLILMAAGGQIERRDSQPNALFRNRDAQFSEITAAAGVADRGFGQGVLVIDFNDDGFDDFICLNIGSNSFYRNNGDGTFSDAADRFEDSRRSRWSSGAAMIDLDSDGYNDLYIANYCELGPGVDQPCTNNGQVVTCHPMRFPAGENDFYRGLPDGRFQLATQQTVDTPSPGRSLGILAGRLDGQNPGLLVANDMTANHFYSAESPPRWPLADRSVAAGVAVDGQSLTQASMGITGGDWDFDGDLDFYVTGFARESNILYRQSESGRWADETSKFGLTEPTLPHVGFGTQAIDLDNDSIDEFLITNGHIGDFGPGMPPYAEPFQVLARNFDGKFAQVELGNWGDYFRVNHIGRALFTLDADLDGRSDAVVTHQTEPVALLINRTSPENHHLALRLVATASPRSAVGAIVTLDHRYRSGSAERRHRSVALLSGSGFQCSNDAVIRIGLGHGETADNVIVWWPSGNRESFGDLPADQLHLLVEATR